MTTTYPSIYQINTRVWLQTLSIKYGKTITLANVPDEELQRVAALGFDWVWLLGVWRTSEQGRQITLEDPDLRQVCEDALPDFQEKDVCSSPFAITGYIVSPDLGGEHGLGLLRGRFRDHGMHLLLDFIPNHTARDHPWLTLHPDYYIAGSEDQLRSQPYNYGRVAETGKVFAFGRDPYFKGWSDTYQLNYGNQDLQEAMRDELKKVAALCDGVRCDMAMLILPDVFEKTWGISMEPFWEKAIEETRSLHPGFLFMAEVYWDLEWTLQQLGFDYTYDKRLYDRLRAQEARPVREHLLAGMDYQSRLVRFLENHDENRAAATFPPQVHPAAAVITFFTPGMRFFHQGQLVGNHTRIPMQLCRGPDEHPDPEIWNMYSRLLEIIRAPVLRDGDWQLLECLPAWQSNWTWDSFVSFSWTDSSQNRLLIAVNYASHQSQCYLRLPWKNLAGKQVHLEGQLHDVNYIRNGDDLDKFGLYLDLTPWEAQVFEVSIE